MTTEERQIVKKKISDTILELEEKIAALEANNQPISPENAIGRVSRMDAINNKGVADAALRNAKRKLDKLRTALKSVEKPEFGVCTLCKGTIPTPRLMFLPESTRCVRCADR